MTMNKTLHKRFRDNILTIALILAVIFAGMNVVLYIINQSYLDQKIEEENNAFLELTTHLIDENDISIALEYIEHYTHIHEVEIEVIDENDVMLFSSNISYRYSRQYHIDTSQGTFTIFMDNTESVTVVSTRSNFLYVNITLLVIYAIAIIVLYLMNKKSTDTIERDLQKVLTLIHNQTPEYQHFGYKEFEKIYLEMGRYLEKIDLLQEQKEINTKGLAHDIKTPLTIVYGFIDHVVKKQPISKDDISNAIDAATSINGFVDDLLEENFEKNNHIIQVDSIITSMIESYQAVFDNKHITMEASTVPFSVHWNEQDAQRIFENLLANAYQYSKPNSVVRITLQMENTPTITIKSNPLDMSKMDIHKIFDKGYSETQKRKKGLGLYLCKLLLDPINATINARTNKDEFIIEIVF